MAKDSTDQLIGMASEWYSKLPPLPTDWREIIVRVTPWVALVFGILGVLGSLSAVGILTVLSPLIVLGAGIGVASGGIIGAALMLVASGLLLFAFLQVKAKREKGWRLLFFSEAVSLLSAVVAVSLGGVAVALIGFYILFQIKPYYK